MLNEHVIDLERRNLIRSLIYLGITSGLPLPVGGKEALAIEPVDTLDIPPGAIYASVKDHGELRDYTVRWPESATRVYTVNGVEGGRRIIVYAAGVDSVTIDGIVGTKVAASGPVSFWEFPAHVLPHLR